MTGIRRRTAAAAAVFFAAGWSLCVWPGTAYAEQPDLVLSGGGRASLRAKSGVPSEIFGRADLLLIPSDPHWNIAPFAEARWDLDDSKISRVELGAEAGVKPFSWHADSLVEKWYSRPLTWFYFGQAVYQRWYKPEFSQSPAHTADKLRQIFPGGSHTEWESRFLFDVPTPWTIGSHPLGLYALDEYIVDLNQGRTIRNEFAFGVKVSLATQRSFGLFLGYRHVDLVHLNDTDQFEGGVQATF